MLGDEHRVATHRGLLAVVFRVGGGQAAVDKIAGMAEDQRQSLTLEISLVLGI